MKKKNYKIKILCTLGPSTLNYKFINFALKNKVSLLRLNLSHIKLNQLDGLLSSKLKKYKNKICIDTEGAQIRTKISKKIFYKKNSYGKIYDKGKKFSLYPENVFEKLKVNDHLDIGFEGLKIRLIKKNSNNFSFITIKSGYLEKNKGVHVYNRKINLAYITKKDVKAIEIAKKHKIKNFALSFTNSVSDIKKFNKLLPNATKIYKIETKKTLQNISNILKEGDSFLIDRGDLSKEIGIEQIPVAQRKILKISKKYPNKNIYIATNFLESMIENPFPSRAEVNDIFNALEMGSKGLVLAAETAIGKHPIECVKLLKKIISTYKSYKL